MKTHCFIPDTQIKPGVPIDHLGWIGQYIEEKRPDIVIHAGDHWDMHSLSIYDKGKRKAEGARYQDDIDAGVAAMEYLQDQWTYSPRKVFLCGNHEQRIERHVNANPELYGKLSYDDFCLNDLGWEFHDFLKPVCIDGVYYVHFVANPMTGKPWGGQAHTRLKNVGFSFTMGHQQVKDIAQIDLTNGVTRRALIAGACYLHDEDYKGYQGNHHWRGIIFKHEVKDGNYCLMELSLDYLCRRYEGVSLRKYKPRVFV